MEKTRSTHHWFMHSPKRHHGIDIPKPDIIAVTDLYEQGLYLQAYKRTKALGPLVDWRGTDARLIAGRLAGNLGNRKIANWLHLRAWLVDRTSAAAACFAAYSVSERLGPYATWKFLQRLPEFKNASPDSKADLLCLRATTLAQFRDFGRAELAMAEAEKLGAHLAWVHNQRAEILEMEDRYEAALERVDASLKSHPWFRPSVQRRAHLLELLNRDDEAAAFLQEALSQTESGSCAAQLSVLLEETGRFQEAIQAWELMRERSPLLDADTLKMWSSRMATLHYLAGDRVNAARNAREVGADEFFQKFAQRLEDPQIVGKRVHLPVGFVRQHHVTCAPATISAVSTYLGQPIDHLDLAREITYDGTADHVERHWLETHGFVVREFRVTWEIAVALLDRGLPFTLTTIETTSGHLQAAIGYDDLRQTLIIRDPYQRHHGEFNVEALLKRYESHGPRGSIFLTPAELPRLDGLDLPDAAFYDLYFAIRRALHEHRREDAESSLAKLAELDGQHRLTLFARRELAYYDGNATQQLATNEALVERYPDCGGFLLAKSRALAGQTQRTERTAFLRSLAAKDVDPMFWRELASDLAEDARTRPLARRLILRALHFQPTAPENLSGLANLLWDERQLELAVKLYRLSACVRDQLEGYSRSYFLASRHLHQTEEALAWLRDRVQRYAGKSSQPAEALFWALDTLDRASESLAVLEDALKARPADGELLLFAADAFARRGQVERANQLLDSAQSKAARNSCLRTAANLAEYQGDLARALSIWRRILDAEPLAIDAQGKVVHLLSEVEGRPSARALLESLFTRFPHYVPLALLWSQWTRSDSAEEWEQVCRRGLKIDPDNASLRRDRALALASLRRYDEALSEVDRAGQIEPESPACGNVRGRVLLMARRLSEARDALKSSLRLSIDSAVAMSDLLNASPTVELKQQAADFIRSELVRQVVFGDGILAFREIFYAAIDPEVMLAAMREAHTARPDLWHAWAALSRQLVDLRRLDEALEIGRKTTERFPLVPGSWADLALVQRHRGDRTGEIESLRRALTINSGWSATSRDLSAALQSLGNFEAAERVMEQAVAASPMDAANHGALASLQYRRNDIDGAIQRASLAVEIEPGFELGWDSLRDWTKERGTPELTVALARKLTESRPGEARSWYRLAQALTDSEREEAHRAIDQAIGLQPYFEDAYDLRATLFVDAGQFEEALKACRPEIYKGKPPIRLQGRAAWIESVRGHLPQAIDLMRAVLKEEPDYYWAWTMLAEWCFKLGRNNEGLEAAEALVRYAPRSPVPLGFLASAHQRLGHKERAVECLRKAFEFDPSYGYAGYTLFDYWMERKALPEATAVLARLELHLPGMQTQAARVRLTARQGNVKPALAELRKLCLMTEDNAASIHHAVAGCIEAGWGKKVRKLLGELITSPGVHPEVGALWMTHSVEADDWSASKRLSKISAESELGQRARFAFLEGVAKKSKPEFLKKLIVRERENLRKTTMMWAQTGYALVSLGKSREVIDWMSDWRQRNELEPWMLHNLAFALRCEKQNADAAVVNCHALTLHGDHTTPMHHVWVALDAAITGKHDEAEMHLAHSHAAEEHHPHEQAASALAQAIIAVERSPADQRQTEYAKQRDLLQGASYYKAFRIPALFELGREGVQRMAHAAGARPFNFGKQISPGGQRSSVLGITIGCIVVAILVSVAGKPQSRKPFMPPPAIPAETLEAATKRRLDTLLAPPITLPPTPPPLIAPAPIPTIPAPPKPAPATPPPKTKGNVAAAPKAPAQPTPKKQKKVER